MTSGKPRAIVVLSGGQDSCTTLIRASQDSEVVGAIHFHYGQKHEIETECAKWWATRYGVELTIIDVPAFGQIGNSNLLVGSGDVREAHPTLSHLPSSFVPGRNLVFLTLAAAFAMKCNATEIWTGVCEADEAGYPDCRTNTLVALQKSIQLGMDFPELRIKAPLLKADKAATWYMAETAGMQFFVKYMTHTCYNGDHHTLNYYGFGCGECASCKTRKEGYDQWLQRYHPTSWEAHVRMQAAQGDDLDFPKDSKQIVPWWTSVENLTDNLKGINTATELPTGKDDEYVINN